MHYSHTSKRVHLSIRKYKITDLTNTSPVTPTRKYKCEMRKTKKNERQRTTIWVTVRSRYAVDTTSSGECPTNYHQLYSGIAEVLESEQLDARCKINSTFKSCDTSSETAQRYCDAVRSIMVRSHYPSWAMGGVFQYEALPTRKINQSKCGYPTFYVLGDKARRHARQYTVSCKQKESGSPHFWPLPARPESSRELDFSDPTSW